MAREVILNKKFLTLSHLATIFAIIGYIAYWLELYFIKLPKGNTSFLAWGIFALYFLSTVSFKKNVISDFSDKFKEFYRHETLANKIFFAACSFLAFLILAVILRVSFLPPHLSQEFDSLNYHITIPRQHLITHSFAHIGWSSADLFLQPLQFSLSPYWLATALPIRLPQVIFVFGLLAVSANLTYKLSRKLLPAFIVIFAIIGSHGFAIQMGIVMLDLIICYFFIAAIDSLLNKKIILSAIEFSFFILSKPFILPQMLIIALGSLLICRICTKLKITQICLGFEAGLNNILFKPVFTKFIIYIFIIGTLIGGPFILKSLNIAGTPLFPFAPGIIKMPNIDKTSAHWRSIVVASQAHITTKDQYGDGRSFFDFLKHLWILSVPEAGVNNRFDYPVGLPYLLFLCPFFYLLIKSFKNKIFPVLPLLAIIYWLVWWFTSQQSRFLYVPLAVLFITVSAGMKRLTKIFTFCLIISLALNFISVFRAHRNDFNKSAEDILRGKDNKLLLLGKDYYKKAMKGTAVLDFSDVAYATFPVRVVPGKSADPRWVLED